MIAPLKSWRAAVGLAVVLALLVALGVQSWRLRAAVSDARAQMAQAESWRAALDDQVAHASVEGAGGAAGMIRRGRLWRRHRRRPSRIDGRRRRWRASRRRLGWMCARRPVRILTRRCARKGTVMVRWSIKLVVLAALLAAPGCASQGAAVRVVEGSVPAPCAVWARRPGRRGRWMVCRWGRASGRKCARCRWSGNSGAGMSWSLKRWRAGARLRRAGEL